MPAPEYMNMVHSDEVKRLLRSQFIAQIAALSILVAAILAVSIIMISRMRAGDADGQAPLWSAGQQRMLATKLKTEGLTDEAVAAFEDYVDRYPVDNAERANVYFALGQMRYGQARYSDALAYFYRVEIADPETPLKKELGVQIVSCLERLGRTIDASYALAARTSLRAQTNAASPRGAVVATVGSREISLGDLADELQKLPPAAQEQMNRPERIQQFLRDYVAARLMADKGRRLGLADDPAIRRQVDDIETSLIIDRVVNDELRARVTIDPADVKLYYEARKAALTNEQTRAVGTNETNRTHGTYTTYSNDYAAAEAAYRAEKSRRALDDFVKELMAAERVRLYPERVRFDARGQQEENR